MLKPAHLPRSRRWTLPEVTSQDESCMTHLYASIANIGLTVFAGGHFKPMGCIKCTMFSAPKVHTHAHAPILHTFLTFTKSTHEQAFTRYGSWLITTRPDWENSFTARIEAPQGERTVFSAHSCKGGEKWPTWLQPKTFQGQAEHIHVYSDGRIIPTAGCLFMKQKFPFGCTHPLPPIPPFLLTQNLTPKDIAR